MGNGIDSRRQKSIAHRTGETAMYLEGAQSPRPPERHIRHIHLRHAGMFSSDLTRQILETTYSDVKTFAIGVANLHVMQPHILVFLETWRFDF